MDQKVFILIGRSGSGKGTQGALLSKFLKEKDINRDTLYIQNGNEFREFIKGNSTTQLISKEFYTSDKLQPEFLSVYMWINVLVNNYNENKHIIFDGAPRRRHEAGVLDSIFDFYNLKNPTVIHINVSEEWATERLSSRHRMDDNKDDIIKRLAWFKSEVIPTINYFKNNNMYDFIEVNGEQTIDKVFQDIVENIKLYK